MQKFLTIYLVLATVIASVGCSSIDSRLKPQSEVPKALPLPEVIDAAAIEEPAPNLPVAPVIVPHVTGTPFGESGEVVVSELGQVPIRINAMVLNWVDYFQGRGRDHMVRYLSRSNRYIEKMKGILKEEGVPEDLIYIALIESGFNSKAYSRAAAVGYWQFIRSTGKRYGLKINGYVDERKDFVLATRAAANYFKSLYNLFGNWYLAMASYNAGENRVKNAVMKYQTRDFWWLAANKKLPVETINYIPKFLAAAMIAKNPEKFGFNDLEMLEPLNYHEVPIAKGISLKKLAQQLDVSYKDLKSLNPAYRGNFVPILRSNTTIRVPLEKAEVASVAVENSSSRMPRQIAASYFYYRVRRGDNLSTIANRHGTSVSYIKRLNHLSPRSLLRIGQKLKVPESTQVASSDVEPSEDGVYHQVRSGENLSEIAKKYKTTVYRLKKLNGMGRKSLIRVGDTLLVRKASNSRLGRSRSYHIVKSGDTLSDIAEKYKLDLAQLLAMNKISKSDRIYVGMRINLQ